MPRTYVVVIFPTQYLRAGNERYLRMTKFWGKAAARSGGWYPPP